mgnify:CR=1 FL=1
MMHTHEPIDVNKFIGEIGERNLTYFQNVIVLNQNQAYGTQFLNLFNLSITYWSRIKKEMQMLYLENPV